MSIDHGKVLDAGVERLRQALKMHNEHKTTLQSLASSVGDFLRDYVALAQPAEAATQRCTDANNCKRCSTDADTPHSGIVPPPDEAVEGREPIAWRQKTKYGLAYSFASEEVMRELCGPAEAVAVFNCPTCPVSVESRWLEPRCPECDGPTELDSSAKPISDDAKRMLALESDPAFRAQYNDAGLEPVASRQIPQNTLASKATHRCDMCGNIDVPDPVVGCRRCGWDEMVLIESAQPRDDAAQGAVAPFGYWLTDCNGIGRFALGDSNQSAIVSYRMTPGYAATPLYTHPQAAPAQVAVAWYVFADTEKWVTLDRSEADDQRGEGCQVRPLIFGDTHQQAAPAQGGES